MNLVKAIEIMALYAGGNYSASREEQIEAMKLGVEALEYVQRDRRGLSDAEVELLPGETNL